MLIILCNFLKMKPSRLEEREWFDHNSLIIEKWGGGEWEEQDKENWQKLYAWGKQLLKISYQKIDQGKNGLKTNTQTKRPEVKTKITKNICGNQGGNWYTMGPEQKQGGGGGPHMEKPPVMLWFKIWYLVIFQICLPEMWVSSHLIIVLALIEQVASGDMLWCLHS